MYFKFLHKSDLLIKNIMLKQFTNLKIGHQINLVINK